MELLKLLSTKEIVAQIISFLILMTCLRAFAWKPILALLDGRRDKIASDFKAASDAKSSAESVRQDYELKLRSIEQTAHVKIDEAVAEGQHAAEDIKKRANLEAQRIVENANANVRFQVGKAKEALRDEIVDLVIASTENLIEARITTDDDRRIVKDFLDKIDTVGDEGKA